MGGARGKVRAGRGPTPTQRLQALERRVRQLQKQLAVEREAHAAALAAATREAEQRLTTMLREIAELRYHEARATRLERLLAAHTAAAAAVPPARRSGRRGRGG